MLFHLSSEYIRYAGSLSKQEKYTYIQTRPRGFEKGGSEIHNQSGISGMISERFYNYKVVALLFIPKSGVRLAPIPVVDFCFPFFFFITSPVSLPSPPSV